MLGDTLMGKVLINDRIVDRSEVTIDIEDRGYQFGDGVYEVFRIYNGKLFTPVEHLERLFQSAKNIQLHVPLNKQELLQLMTQVIKENEIKDGIFYLQVTRGVAPRNHLFPAPEVSSVLTGYTKEVPRPVQLLKEGVKAITLEDIRWLRCDIKSLNLLPNVLAKQEAHQQGCFEAILHRNGIVTEGSSSNVFIISNGMIHTHPPTNMILNGITRQVIIELCQKEEVPVVEKPFTLEELLLADEVFISSTTIEVMPLIEINGQPIGTGHPGIITKQLQTRFQEKIAQELLRKTESYIFH